jgi:hypothetical protein
MRLTQFGYNVTVAIWLIPIVGLAFWRNANATGAESDFYAIASIVCLALLGFAAWSAYQSSGLTASVQVAEERKADKTDAAVLSFENLSAWKWAYCLLIGVIAVCSAVGHYLMNRNSEGFMATFLLIYAVVDAAIAFISLNQFWAIKSGKIVELSNKVSGKMFQH